MQKVAFLLLPALVGILLYSNSFNHEYVLDDEEAIVQNRIVQQGLDGISEMWVTEYRAGFSTEKGSLYRPMALTLLQLRVRFGPKTQSLHMSSMSFYMVVLHGTLSLAAIVVSRSRSLVGINDCSHFCRTSDTHGGCGQHQKRGRDFVFTIWTTCFDWNIEIFRFKKFVMDVHSLNRVFLCPIVKRRCDFVSASGIP